MVFFLTLTLARWAFFAAAFFLTVFFLTAFFLTAFFLIVFFRTPFLAAFFLTAFFLTVFFRAAAFFPFTFLTADGVRVLEETRAADRTGLVFFLSSVLAEEETFRLDVVLALLLVDRVFFVTGYRSPAKHLPIVYLGATTVTSCETCS